MKFKTDMNLVGQEYSSYKIIIDHNAPLPNKNHINYRQDLIHVNPRMIKMYFMFVILVVKNKNIILYNVFLINYKNTFLKSCPFFQFWERNVSMHVNCNHASIALGIKCKLFWASKTIEHVALQKLTWKKSTMFTVSY